LFDINCYSKIIRAISSGKAETVRVGERCVQLSYENTRNMCKNPKILNANVKKKFNDCFRDAPGACVAISRKAFINIGGHCELFKVYGWEDCYFRHKVKKLTRVIRLKEQMLHLQHEENWQSGRQAANLPLYEALLYTDNGDGVKLSKRDKKDLLKKYPGMQR
jgi:hypothetical protein